MKDERQQVLDMMSNGDLMDEKDFVDALFDRFDIRRKEVVTHTHLGRMVVRAGGMVGVQNYESIGKKMLTQLDAACLRLVKCDK